MTENTQAVTAREAMEDSEPATQWKDMSIIEREKALFEREMELVAIQQRKQNNDGKSNRHQQRKAI